MHCVVSVFFCFFFFFFRKFRLGLRTAESKPNPQTGNVRRHQEKRRSVQQRMDEAIWEFEVDRRLRFSVAGLILMGLWVQDVWLSNVMWVRIKF